MLVFGLTLVTQILCFHWFYFMIFVYVIVFVSICFVSFLLFLGSDSLFVVGRNVLSCSFCDTPAAGVIKPCAVSLKQALPNRRDIVHHTYAHANLSKSIWNANHKASWNILESVIGVQLPSIMTEHQLVVSASYRHIPIRLNYTVPIHTVTNRVYITLINSTSEQRSLLIILTQMLHS